MSAGRRDWFRNHDWSPEIESEFFKRLGRAREYGRAQYLRVQAAELVSCGKASLAEVAIDLIDRMLREYPKNRCEKAIAWYLRADSLIVLGRIDQALESFRQAMRAQRECPSFSTNAHLDFLYHTAVNSRHELYDEAMEYLREFDRAISSELYPVHGFRRNAALALIYADRGDEAAASLATAALAYADAKSSGLSRHPELGLVGAVDPILLRRLTSLSRP